LKSYYWRAEKAFEKIHANEEFEIINGIRSEVETAGKNIGINNPEYLKP